MSALAKIANRFRPEPRPARWGRIGVHFSQSSLHLLQLERTTRQSLALAGYANQPLLGNRDETLSSTPKLKAVIAKALKQSRFQGRRTISAMPLDRVKLMSISYPAVAPEAEPATIANLMADRVSGDLADYVIDYVPVRTSVRDGERLCIVAVSRKEDVLQYLDTLGAAGLVVDALEVSPLSVRRLVECMGSAGQIENVLAINVGQDKTYLTLISGRRLLANQELDFGEARLVDMLSRTLELSSDVALGLLLRNGLRSVTTSSGPDQSEDVAGTLRGIVRPQFDKLVDAIERSFLYASSESYGQSKKRIYLFGSVAEWRGVCDLLGDLTKIPVQRMTPDLLPFSMDKLDVGRRNCGPGLAVAAGLALWEMQNDD